MEIQTIIVALKTSGWEEDRFGNFKSTSGLVRVRIKKTVIRVERKYTPEVSVYIPKPVSQWMNIVSDYIKNVQVKDNKVVIKGKILKEQVKM